MSRTRVHSIQQSQMMDRQSPFTCCNIIKQKNPPKLIYFSLFLFAVVVSSRKISKMTTFVCD